MIARPRLATAALLASLLAPGCLANSGSGGSSGGGHGGASSTSTAATTASSTTSSTTSGGSCITVADCPGTDTPCAHRTCNAGVCGADLAPLGTLTGTQIAGDCHANVCDGMGAVIVVIDDSDAPADGNPCTADICSNGVPLHTPASGGTACGAGLTCNGAGTCIGCTKDSDCGANTACITHTCASTGACAVTFTPYGMGDPGGQTAGDCVRVTCDGSGSVILVVDDSDLPDDGNPCTADACSAGTPIHTLEPQYTSCGTGFVCDGMGLCLGCLADADCGTSTPCTTYICSAGTCTKNDAPLGQGDLGGPAGDCHRLTCAGDGNSIAVPDDGDVPDDGNPCTADACSNGVPSHTPLAAAAPCGAGLECDGAGHCVGCIADVECGTSTVCATYQCQAGTCVTEVTPAGTGDPGGQVAGDCKRITCNGFGGTATVPDDADVPDDGNPCTADACSNGVSSHTPLAAATPCGAGLECDGSGACLGCIADAECGASSPCATHLCQAGSCTISYTPAGTGNPGGQIAGDCMKLVCNGSGGTISVIDASDVPDDGNPCTADTCSGGAPGHTFLAVGASCGAGMECDGAGHCVGCLTDADCGTSGVCATRTCQAGTCVASYAPAGTDAGGQVAGDCKKIVCDGSGGTTVQPDDTDVHDDGNACTYDFCVGGLPHNDPLNGKVCGAGMVCLGNACVTGCWIGTYYAPGALNPGNHCQMCDPSTYVTAWTNASSTTFCNDNNACSINDHCSNGSCVGGGVAPDGTTCQGAAPFALNGVCVGGSCQPGCWVDGAFHFSQSYFLDTQVCQTCDPTVSTTSLYVGGCHYGSIPGSCDGHGVCNLLTGACSTGCVNCGVQQCGGGKCTGAPIQGATCSDGNPCTADLCDNFGYCNSTPVADGTSCGSGMTCTAGTCQ